MQTLEDNIQKVKARIRSACKQSQRNNNSVNLLAVSKTQDISTIKFAYDIGLREFGENYVNEAKEKIPSLPEDICWHFIGPIQSNKTRFIAESFDWVETVDRAKIAQRLNDQRPDSKGPLYCLIQVNISEEEQKAGIAPAEVQELASFIEALPKLKLRGLMAIPSATSNNEALENDFAKMADLLRQLQQNHPEADTLSIGMSKDLDVAIAQGSTQVRIGTDIFGKRPAKPS